MSIRGKIERSRVSEKDYQQWMPIKAKVHNNAARPLRYREREIWICNVGENVGFEEDGKNADFTRPVLILKSYNGQFCHVVPLSTTERRGKFWYPFDGHTDKISVALLSQSRAIDTSRLHEKIGYASKSDFEAIKNGVLELLS
jgi:mRNA-degrading endonuclease toxin of MazEF toxin-antitoxin module